MRIDSTHRPWMHSTLAALGLLAASFLVYAAASVRGPKGGSTIGILYGVAGYGLMLYAALLGLRKKVPVWRIGRAQTWMRGHLWMGALSLPLILFHCGFAWKGSLASLLMLLLFLTVVSGITGAAVQHFVPAAMTRAIPMETIYEEIPNVRRQLWAEADALAAGVSEGAESHDVEISPDVRARFASIYKNTIRAALTAEIQAGVKRTAPANLTATFESLRTMLPAKVHGVIADIQSICEEDRQLREQKRIYLWLHGWLLVHVPASIALLVLGAIHAAVALRY